MGGPSASSERTQNQIAQQQIATSQQANTESAQTYATTSPGLSTAENYYQSLASGDPTKIFQSIAPAVGQIDTASQGATQQIRQNMPRGGVEQLAEANVQQQRAGQVGNLGTSAYTGSFPALAALSQGGLSLSANELANSITAGSAASSANEGLMQAQSAGKTATMGALGGLAGGAGSAAGGGLEGKGAAAACWIAEVIFGVDDLHTHIIRFWLNGQFKKTAFGAAVMWLYRSIGREVAWCVGRSEFLRELLRPMFDLAFRKAIGVRS